MVSMNADDPVVVAHALGAMVVVIRHDSGLIPFFTEAVDASTDVS